MSIRTKDIIRAYSIDWSKVSKNNEDIYHLNEVSDIGNVIGDGEISFPILTAFVHDVIDEDVRYYMEKKTSHDTRTDSDAKRIQYWLNDFFRVDFTAFDEWEKNREAKYPPFLEVWKDIKVDEHGKFVTWIGISAGVKGTIDGEERKCVTEFITFPIKDSMDDYQALKDILGDEELYGLAHIVAEEIPCLGIWALWYEYYISCVDTKEIPSVLRSRQCLKNLLRHGSDYDRCGVDEDD